MTLRPRLNCNSLNKCICLDRNYWRRWWKMRLKTGRNCIFVVVIVVVVVVVFLL